MQEEKDFGNPPHNAQDSNSWHLCWVWHLTYNFTMLRFFLYWMQPTKSARYFKLLYHRILLYALKVKLWQKRDLMLSRVPVFLWRRLKQQLVKMLLMDAMFLTWFAEQTHTRYHGSLKLLFKLPVTYRGANYQISRTFIRFKIYFSIKANCADFYDRWLNAIDTWEKVLGI